MRGAPADSGHPGDVPGGGGGEGGDVPGGEAMAHSLTQSHQTWKDAEDSLQE